MTSLQTRNDLIAICLGATIILSACVQSEPWRIPNQDDPLCNATVEGDNGLIEKIDTNTTLAFIEFTERGNLFNRGCANRVYDYIETTINNTGSAGVSIVVFVHGWKHNASPDDSNITDFKNILRDYSGADDTPTARNLNSLPFKYPSRYEDGVKKSSVRKVIGVYIGWRGSSFRIPGLPFAENLSYWDRKSVAEEVGKGGVTEVFLTLRRLTFYGTRKPVNSSAEELENDNIYLVIGHSFGAGIVLSALNEIMLDRIINATQRNDFHDVETERLSDGVLLLNPAIEANELLQVREQINANRYSPWQDVMMHIMSSQGDQATHRAFPAGQWLGTLFWNQEELSRKISNVNDPIKLNEHKLDLTTVGNYPPYWTGFLFREDDSWKYQSLTNSTPVFDRGGKLIDNHIYTPRNSPIQVIYTDKDFIENHNKIFNHRVLAYSASIVNESLALVRKRPVPCACLAGKDTQNVVRNDKIAQLCEGSNLASFSFGKCFNYYMELFRPKPSND